MSQQVANGQRVSVSFEGRVTGPDSIGTYVEDSEGRMIYVAWELVTQLDPDHWPPQVGDIWEARGHEYIIRDPDSLSGSSRANTRARAHAIDNTPYLVVSPLDAGAPTLRGRFDELRAANPTLIRRRGGFHK